MPTLSFCPMAGWLIILSKMEIDIKALSASMGKIYRLFSRFFKRSDNRGNDRQESPPDYPPTDPEPYQQRAGQSGQGNDPGFVDDEIPF